MSDSICKFVPAKQRAEAIRTVHFVYESDFHTLPQPFLHPIYYLHLVMSGTATLKIFEYEYELTPGSLFFSFPAVPFQLEGSVDFKYFYISFMGTRATALLDSLEVGVSSAVYRDFNHLTDLWMSSITRVNPQNANILSEGVLLYTLSFLHCEKKDPEPVRQTEQFFDMMVDYIDGNYRDPEMSLKKIAHIFNYTEKYISRLFKRKMNLGFNHYLNNIRIQYALELMARDIRSVSEIAENCGYSDAHYFSRVFKKNVGCSPTEYMKKESP